MSADRMLPLHRLRLVNPGESFDAGDRTFTAVVPPVFDSPTARGLLDSSTDLYWAADAFATYVPGQVDDIGELPAGFFREAFLQAQRMVSPWHLWLDAAKYQAHLDHVRSFAPRVAVSAHGVPLAGGDIGSAFNLLTELPHLPAPQLLGQGDLDALLAIISAPSAA